MRLAGILMQIPLRLIDTIIHTDCEQVPVVLNCQLGRGRSTNTAVMVYLIQQWIKHNRRRSSSNAGDEDEERGYRKNQSRLPSYQIINGELQSRFADPRSLTRRFPDLLRVLRNGIRIKEEVDDAIDKVCPRCPGVSIDESSDLAH